MIRIYAFCFCFFKRSIANIFRNKMFVPFFLLVVFFMFHGNQVKAQGTTGNAFGNVAFGGGGFITGIISHKTSGDVYCRTDVGGIYRWDAANSEWIPLLDWNSEDETTYQGVEALALDPQNENNLYLFAGTDYFNGGKTAILKSTDKGNTFSVVEVTSQFKTHGNSLGRGNGERLAVDPNNSNILFCGSQANGLFKSTNGGSSWTLAWNGVTTTTNGNGICFVVFDPSSASGGVSQTIYIGVSRTGAGNIYKSTDGGNTFTAIQPDNSFMPHRAVLSSDNSTLYVSMADSEGPSNGNSGRVYKLATATGTWTNITPEGNNYPYGGISVDPTNKNRVIVSTVNVWDNNQFCNNVWGDRIYLSTDGGSTWTSKLTCTSTLDPNGIGWIAPFGIHWADCIDFDPSNTAKVRVMSGNGLFTCDDINASAVSWKFDVKGIEETVVLDAISIPGGPLITALGDQRGVVYASDIYTYPTQLINPSSANTTTVAYAANNTSKVVRVTDNMYYSTDQGASWTQTTSINGSYGKVALSADGNTILHCPSGQSTTYYSTNNGGTWTSTGVTNVQDAQPIADYVNTNKFYIYNRGSGQLLVSTNKGVSFTASSSNPGTGGSVRARAVPGNEGHVWVALNNGLTYTTNSGTSWTTDTTTVTYCRAVGFGKAATGATYPAIYIWGTVSGVNGMFRSTDQGASWTRINDDAHEWGGVGNGNFVLGDMNVYGRAYMCTVGRGLVVIESGGCTSTAITPYVQIDGGTWTQTANASVTSGGSVMFGPQPATGGSWSWSGPNGFTASTREINISNIQTNQAGNYVATYTNDGGCQSTQTFAVTVTAPCNPTAITPYVQVNGGTWQQTANASVVAGGSVMFGPQPTTGGSWSWSGPNNYSATTREISISNIQTNQAGSYVATYTNDTGCQSTQVFDITIDAATGTILREYWTGISGTAITDLTSSSNYPSNPSGSEQLTSLEGPTNWADNYGTRIRGYIHPTATGDYTFWVAGDDNTDLYLSTNDNPSNSTRIAYVSGWTNSGEWSKYGTQQSATVSLTAGQKYYIEVLHKEGSGGDNVAVAWQGPGITQQVIGGAYLSPFIPLKSATIEPGISSDTEETLNEVILYPNPTIGGKFSIALPEFTDNVTISIFNMQGKLLYQKNEGGLKQLEFDQHLDAGLYLVKISTDKFCVTKKLIVN